MNKEYVAFDLLNTDPLDETSVEHLCAQNEIWLERVKKEISCDQLDEIVPIYQGIGISSEKDFGKRIEQLFRIVDDG